MSIQIRRRICEHINHDSQYIKNRYKMVFTITHVTSVSCVCVCVLLQGGRYVGHGSAAAGELSSRLPDHPHAGAGRHRAHAAQGHQELLRGRSRAQTSLSAGVTKDRSSEVRGTDRKALWDTTLNVSRL